MSRSGLSQTEKAVLRHIEYYFAPPSSVHFIIAVSGGVDSMCLLHAFKKLGVSALVAHINYQKRGEASDKDAEFVEQMATRWGFECHTVQANPAEAGSRNFQQWARTFRYSVFRELAQQHDADAIAIAHHEDDQVETILQKIFRGAGLGSWSGMPIFADGIFRPWLNISQQQIHQYARRHNIPYRTDESNLENSFARNLLRNEWLDKLKHFFPGWKKNVLRIPNEANNYGEAIDWICDRVTDEQGIKRDDYHSLPDSLQRAVVLKLLKKKAPGIQVSRDTLRRVTELIDLQTGKQVQLTPQWAIIRDREHYIIDAQEEDSFASITLERDQLIDQTVTINELEITIKEHANPDYGYGLHLDADKIKWPVTLRRWQSGDTFQPLGMQGHQTVADHLTNRKVPSADKQKALVVESFEDTICGLIFTPIKKQSMMGTISEQVKCDTDTKQCLRIINST